MTCRVPAFRTAPIVLLVVATSLVAACSDDDPSTTASTAIGGDLSQPPDDAAVEPDGGEGPEDDGPDEGGVTSGGENPDGVGMPEIPPGRDDRPALIVRFPGDRDPAALSSPWLAIVSAFQIASVPELSGDIRLKLSRYDDGVAFLAAADFYTPELDVCDIRMPEEPDDDGDGDDEVQDFESVGGGVALTLSSAGAPWVTVPFSPDTGVYNGNNVFPAAAPDDLTLSIPGAAFPRIDALPLSAPAAPERLSPTFDEIVTDATEYRWVPADDGTFVQITFKRFVDGQFAGFPVSCDVADDGVFELPDDVVATLAALPGVTTVRYARRIERLDFRDGITVFRTFGIADD